jgi:ubiquinone/menaquinone biosynthesis C-methylase UbiE
MNELNTDGVCVESPRDQVRKLYAKLALNPEQDFGWNKGKDNAKQLGYDQRMLDQIPDVVWESSAAVGNPFSVGPINKGETVVDLGCGAGADLCVAALLVGDTGKVVGIDLTPEMVEKARGNVTLMGLTHAKVELGDFLKLPLADSTVDVVISNGAINLSPKQACVLREIFRVLKPHGRLYLADMIRPDSSAFSSCHLDNSADSWANCVAGTLSKACLEKLISDTGFQDVTLVKMTGYHTSPETEGAIFRATKPAT